MLCPIALPSRSCGPGGPGGIGRENFGTGTSVQFLYSGTFGTFGKGAVTETSWVQKAAVTHLYYPGSARGSHVDTAANQMHAITFFFSPNFNLNKIHNLERLVNRSILFA